MSAADELRAAADTLRAVAPQITGRLADLADPVADWLTETAVEYDAAVVAARQVWGDESHEKAHEWLTTGHGRIGKQALAVARAINGSTP